MSTIGKDATILHVEDDSSLAWIVRTAFQDFGFTGTMITEESVRKAMDLLNERERTRQHLSLIISDMRLPDGSGLELIREVKANPYWRATPVIVLSGNRDPEVIDSAYALGANSYLPKDPPGGNLVVALQSFYQCWLENVQLPQHTGGDRVKEVLDRAIGLRVRTSEFYLDLARASKEEPEIAFWLDRALAAGNLSNLLAFFRDKLSERDFPPDVVDRLVSAQVQVVDSLITAEKHLKNVPSPAPELIYEWVLELTDAFQEEVFTEALGGLFPKSPVVAAALEARAAAQVKALAIHILDHTRQAGLRERAAALLHRGHRIEKGGR